MPTFKLDDHEIAFEPGDTIIRAAHRAGVDIPHYCWHPGLSVAANCRMCLVELMPPPGRKAMMLDVLRWDPALKEYVKEQKPKLAPACQQAAAEGLEVLSQTSAHVTKARAAVQEMLLLNHPVDCPICDQAGECRLQDYWLNHGAQKKRMRDEPVHKPKGVVFGPTIVYDAERCIVCTRCVRVCEEVAKDPVLEVTQRGNLNEISVAPGRQLDHDYTLMTEHVCPVGALTSSDFRFKARVWFLRTGRGVCTGCERGCNQFVDFDPRTNQVHRVRPRENEAVNGHWMCDAGMLGYHRLYDQRVTSARFGVEPTTPASAVERATKLLGAARGKGLALILGAEFSLEDNAALAWLGRALGAELAVESGRAPGKADAILQLADKNPNSVGVRQVLGGEPRPFAELVAAAKSGSVTLVLGLGSETKLVADAAALADTKVERILLTAHEGPLLSGAKVVLPASAPLEVNGTYVNHAGLAQQSDGIVPAPGDCSPVTRWVQQLAKGLGLEPSWNSSDELRASLLSSELQRGSES